MKFGMSLVDFMKKLEMQSFLISLGASATWEVVKSIFLKEKMEESLQTQALYVIRDTFELFCQKKSFEFDETAVMDAFFEVTKAIDDFEEKQVTKEMLVQIFGYEAQNRDVKEWTELFVKVCSNPKYQWVYNKIMFPKEKLQSGCSDKGWMAEYMKENYCKIKCDTEAELLSIFKDVTTVLPTGSWYAIRVLVVEVILNAQQHGQAKKCILTIDENSITIYDNGTTFDVLSLEKQKKQSGGCLALKRLKTECPELSLHSENDDRGNYFTMSFQEKTFNVNELSEIIVPNLVCRERIRFKYPKGEFRYYYINVDEIPKTEHGELFVTISGIYGLLDELKREFSDKPETEKIFISCTDIEREDYKYVCGQILDVLERWGYESSRVKLELVGDVWDVAEHLK